MAITFPIPQADLGDQLPIKSVEWELERHQETSMDGSGEFLVADLAPPLWMGTVELRPLLKTEARKLEAKFNALDGGIWAFYLANPMGWWPASDPGGVLYDTSTPTIGNIETNRKELSILDLPVGYVLQAGDFLSITYGTNRRGLFQLVSDVVVDGAGTANVEVRPHLSTGILPSDEVTFAKPAAKVKVLPSTFKKTWYNNNRDVITFNVRQTLQAS